MSDQVITVRCAIFSWRRELARLTPSASLRIRSAALWSSAFTSLLQGRRVYHVAALAPKQIRTGAAHSLLLFAPCFALLLLLIAVRPSLRPRGGSPPSAGWRARGTPGAKIARANRRIGMVEGHRARGRARGWSRPRGRGKKRSASRNLHPLREIFVVFRPAKLERDCRARNNTDVW